MLRKRFKLLQQPDAALVFTAESEVLAHVLAEVKQDEIYIQPQNFQHRMT